MITVLLILTLLLGGVGWTPEVLLSWVEMLLIEAWGAPSWISTPIGESRDVITPLLSVGDGRSRSASRLLSRLSDVGLLLGCIASRMLLRRVVGLLISARYLLTLEVRGDLARCLERQSWWRSTGVAAMAINAWLIGFSLGIAEHVVMAMVGGGWCVVLTFRMRRRLVRLKINECICSSPMARPLAWLHCSVPIVGVQVHPRWGVEVVSVC